jgi:hypothetical protein
LKFEKRVYDSLGYLFSSPSATSTEYDNRKKPNQQRTKKTWIFGQQKRCAVAITLTISSLSLEVKAKVFGLGGNDAEGVGVTHAPSPTLDGDDGVALGKDTEVDGVLDAPSETLVDILLP